jgi:hypothetical protein
MNKEQKIRLADMLLEFVSNNQEDRVNLPRMVGTLTKAQGLNGFKRAEIGTPVFDIGDKYMIMIESLDGNRNVEVTYYKDTLKPVIEFDGEAKVIS